MNGTMTKERPILFSAPMVRAILDGRKTQTRRIVKPQPVFDGRFWNLYGASWSDRISTVPVIPGHSLAVRNPYGQVGDRLWVRETWGINECGKRVSLAPAAWPNGWPVKRLVYNANENIPTYSKRVSIHMPRWASRIDLEITDIRVERLNEISEGDAIAEGCERVFAADGSDYGAGLTTACEQFETLWESINGPGSWAANPWVWVVEFKRVEA